MPPGTRNALMPPSQNAFGAPPTLAEIQLAQRTYPRPAPLTLSEWLTELQYGLGEGLGQAEAGNLEFYHDVATRPVGVYEDLVAAAKAVAKNPSLVVNGLRAIGQQAASGPRGLGEVVGGFVNPRNFLKPRSALKKDIFVGPKSKTWNSNTAAAAVQMERQGASPEQIWEATGNWRGPDGNWRQEIGDDKTKFRDDFAKRGLTEENKFQFPPAKPLPEALSAPELIAAYPQLQSLSVNTRKLPDWVPDTSNSGGELATMTNRPVGIFAYNKTEGGALDTTAHELQHVVQKLEGFAPGGVPTQFYRQVEQELQQNNPQQWAALTKEQRRDLVETESFRRYRNLMGEAEARATAARRNLSWLERRQRFPGLDYDVPIDELIR